MIGHVLEEGHTQTLVPLLLVLLLLGAGHLQLSYPLTCSILLVFLVPRIIPRTILYYTTQDPQT